MDSATEGGGGLVFVTKNQHKKQRTQKSRNKKRKQHKVNKKEKKKVFWFLDWRRCRWGVDVGYGGLFGQGFKSVECDSHQ